MITSSAISITVEYILDLRILANTDNVEGERRNEWIAFEATVLYNGEVLLFSSSHARLRKKVLRFSSHQHFEFETTMHMRMKYENKWHMSKITFETWIN